MYQKKIYQPTESELHSLREFMKTDWFRVLEKWADWEYVEWCKYVASLIPELDLMNEEDKRTMEKENDVVTAVSDFFTRVKWKNIDYIWDPINP